MSEEQLKAFLEKVKADTSLQEKLKAAVMLMQLLQLRKMLALASLLMSFGPRFQKRNWKV